MITDKEIYDLIAGIGEVLQGELHIIDQTYAHTVDEREGEFRVYHSSGYCIDVKKEYVCEPGDVKYFDDVDEDGFVYSWFSEWDGFHAIANNNQLYALLTKFIAESKL